jgi:hypothetical protein
MSKNILVIDTAMIFTILQYFPVDAFPGFYRALSNGVNTGMFISVSDAYEELYQMWRERQKSVPVKQIAWLEEHKKCLKR